MTTVSEIIAELSTLDPDLRVVVRGYEGGWDDPAVRLVRIDVDANWDKTTGKKVWWFEGQHGNVGFADPASQTCEAVAL